MPVALSCPTMPNTTDIDFDHAIAAAVEDGASAARIRLNAHVDVMLETVAFDRSLRRDDLRVLAVAAAMSHARKRYSFGEG